MYELPVTVEVNGKEYAIRDRADYRTMLSTMALLEDVELSEQERLVSALIVFYDDLSEPEDIYYEFGDDVDAPIYEMFGFLSCAYDDTMRANSKVKLVDWVQDEKLIVPAINNVAKTEIRALPYLHWWTFLGYYMSIGESLFSTVIGIRDKIAKNQKLEKHEERFRRENPQYFRWKDEELESKNWLESVWNKKE